MSKRQQRLLNMLVAGYRGSAPLKLGVSVHNVPFSAALHELLSECIIERRHEQYYPGIHFPHHIYR